MIKILVIGGLTHTGRLWTRGYAGMSHSGRPRRCPGTTQWKKLVADDGLIWQMLIDIDQSTNVVNNNNDTLMLFSIIVKYSPKTEDTLIHLNKHAESN